MRLLGGGDTFAAGRLADYEWGLGIGGFLLMADLALLPWHRIDIHLPGEAGISFTRTGIESPGALAGILAFLLGAVLVLAVVLPRLAPRVVAPTVVGACYVAAGPVVVVVLLVKWSLNTDFLGIGCWFGLLVALVLAIAGLRAGNAMVVNGKVDLTRRSRAPGGLSAGA